MTDNRVKVEIQLQDTREWQWMGLMTDEQLKKLCAYADRLSDGEEE